MGLAALTTALPPASFEAPVPTKAAAKTEDPAKIHDAAQQFEALLLGQILQAAHQGSGWLGTGEDSSSGCATGFAEQQLAVTMAKQGGFGLSHMIEAGLRRG